MFRPIALALIAVLALAACADNRLSTFNDGVKAPPGTPEIDDAVDGLTVGHRLMSAGYYELALKAYLRAAADHGATVDVLSAIGSANLKLGRLGQAENLLRKAIEKDEKFAPAWNNLGVVLVERGEIGEAARVFKVAFALDSGESAEIRENLRFTLANLENPAYSGENITSDYKLVRRGAGSYQLLSTP